MRACSAAEPGKEVRVSVWVLIYLGGGRAIGMMRWDWVYVFVPRFLGIYGREVGVLTGRTILVLGQ